MCKYCTMRENGAYCMSKHKYIVDMVEEHFSQPYRPRVFICPKDAGTERSNTECYYINTTEFVKPIEYEEVKEEKRMKNVTINGKVYEVVGGKCLKLNNGCLVLHFNKLGDVMGAYIVTSFRDQKNSLPNKESTANYCSLVDLDTGYLAFEERCSRNTTVARVLSHLNQHDFEARQALKDGQYVEVYNMGSYKIDLTFNKEEKQ